MRRSLSFKPLALSRTFIFLLIAYGLQLTAYPQEKRTDIEIYRNSIRTFSFVIKNKDVSTDKLYFTVKKERVDSLDRLIYRRNLLAGGADDQISASYSSPNSTVNVFVRRIDNWDLKPGIYQYDLISVDASDSNIVIPLYTGAFKIKENVLNAWDGTNLPDSGRTWFVLGEGKYQNDFAVYDSISGRWLPITVDSVIKLLSIEAGSTPDSVIYPYETTNFVTKTDTQTITGEKTFDASKTVFSGDSVGVRGNLEVDGNISLATNNNLYLSSGVSGDVNYFTMGNFFAGQRGLLMARGSLGNIFQVYQDNIVLMDSSFIGFRLSGGNPSWSIAIGTASNLNTTIGLYGGNSRIELKSDSVGVRGNLNLDGNLKTLTSTITNAELSYLAGAESNIQEQLNAMVGGSVGNADSLAGIPGTLYALDADVDSILKVSGDTYKLDFSGLEVNQWLTGLENWTTGLIPDLAGVMKIGKENRQIYFNNNFDASSDYWLLDYIQHPFNLPYENQIMREFRTDYYNDTLKTFQSIANLTFLDTVGTGIWHPDGFSYVHNQNALGIGDLPDSTTAVFNGGGTVGVQFQLQENNKTAGAKRFPMKVKGFEFKFGSTPYYTYPILYGYYSDLTTNSPNLETAYHFYGLGDFPIYTQGLIQTERTLEIMGEYKLPEVDGTSGQVMKTDGNGVLTWQNDTGGGGGSLFEQDGNGNLMPITGSGTDSYYELDGSGNIQPL